MEAVGTILVSAVEMLMVLLAGVILLASGLYMTVGKWWNERELAATLRYHLSCDESVCSWKE